MTLAEKNERIKQLEKELQELKATPHKSQRWRAAEGEAYYIIDSEGEIKLTFDYRCKFDDLMHKNGNYFRTRKDAERSFIDFAINGEYEFWIPESGMHKPKTVPEGVQYYHDCAWRDNTTRPGYAGDSTDYWERNLYRWPKSSYSGKYPKENRQCR